MVLLQIKGSGGSEWRALFADGYLELDRLRVLEQDEAVKRRLGAGIHALDDILLASIDLLLRRYTKAMGVGGEMDVFLINSPNGFGAEHLGSRYLPLWRELEHEPKERQYRIVCIIEEHQAGNLDSYVRGLNSLGLRLKDEREYANLDAYRDACVRLGERLLEPYEAPCLIAEARIQQSGFRCLRP